MSVSAWQERIGVCELLWPVFEVHKPALNQFIKKRLLDERLFNVNWPIYNTKGFIFYQYLFLPEIDLMISQIRGKFDNYL